GEVLLERADGGADEEDTVEDGGGFLGPAGTGDGEEHGREQRRTTPEPHGRESRPQGRSAASRDGLTGHDPARNAPPRRRNDRAPRASTSPTTSVAWTLAVLPPALGISTPGTRTRSCAVGRRRATCSTMRLPLALWATRCRALWAEKPSGKSAVVSTASPAMSCRMAGRPVRSPTVHVPPRTMPRS